MSNLYSSATISENKVKNNEIKQVNLDYQQNTSVQTANVNNVETETMELDLEEESTTINSSEPLTSQEYEEKLNTKSKETEKIIDIVNKMKEESEKEYENLNKIGNDYDHGDSLNNQQFSVQNTINSVDMEIRNEVAKYESGTKDTNDLGYTEEEFEKLSYDEKVEAIADNNEFMKNMLKSKEISIERLNELTKERTGYDSYEEYQEAISNLESDIAMLELTIARLEEQQKILPYAMLPDTSDFQEFQYNKELKEAKDYLCSDTKYEIDYLRYCKDNGDISPLEFIKLYEEKYDNLPDYIRGIGDYKELKQLLELSKEDENYAKIYNYLYVNEGREAAEEYLSALVPQLNQREGEKQAKEFLATLKKDENGNYDIASVKNHFKSYGKGFGDGVEDFFQGIVNWFNSEGVRTANDYEMVYIIKALQEDGVGLNTTYEIGQTMGNITPSVAIGLFTTPLIGSISAGVSAGGNAYASSLADGYTQPEALLYGVLTMSSTALLEKVMSGIPGLSDIQVTGIKSLLAASVQSGAKGAIQPIVDAIMRSAIFQEEIDIDELITKCGTAAVYRAITAGVFNSGNLVINASSESLKKLSQEKGFDQNIIKEKFLNGNTIVDKTIKNNVAKLVDKTNISEKNIYKIISKFQEKAGTTMKEASTVIAGQALVFANSAKNIGLKFANNINADEVVYGTLCCELGAEANYEKMEKEKSANIETLNVAKQTTVTDKDNTALNTALTVMTSDMIEDKTQRSVIATLAMCSTNFTEEEIANKEAWNNNINEISSAVEQYNKENNTNYTFDVDAINELMNDETEFARIQNEVTAIKEGMTIENA